MVLLPQKTVCYSRVVSSVMDEFIHWLIISSGSSLCFDVDGEQLKQMPMPPIPQMSDGMEQRNVRYFGESRGRLLLVEIHGRPPQANTQLDVYEMRTDNSGWFVNHHIDLDAVAGAFPEMIMSSSLEFWELTSYGFVTLAFARGESDEDSFSVLLHITGKVTPYDFKEKNFVMFNVYQYVESLACV